MVVKHPPFVALSEGGVTARRRGCHSSGGGDGGAQREPPSCGGGRRGEVDAGADRGRPQHRPPVGVTLSKARSCDGYAVAPLQRRAKCTAAASRPQPRPCHHAPPPRGRTPHAGRERGCPLGTAPTAVARARPWPWGPPTSLPRTPPPLCRLCVAGRYVARPCCPVGGREGGWTAQRRRPRPRGGR